MRQQHRHIVVHHQDAANDDHDDSEWPQLDSWPVLLSIALVILGTCAACYYFPWLFQQ